MYLYNFSKIYEIILDLLNLIVNLYILLLLLYIYIYKDFKKKL
jgi:hypothetical protein